jgi:hypothetical protein
VPAYQIRCSGIHVQLSGLFLQLHAPYQVIDALLDWHLRLPVKSMIDGGVLCLLRGDSGGIADEEAGQEKEAGRCAGGLPGGKQTLLPESPRGFFCWWPDIRLAGKMSFGCALPVVRATRFPLPHLYQPSLMPPASSVPDSCVPAPELLPKHHANGVRHRMTTLDRLPNAAETP